MASNNRASAVGSSPILSFAPFVEDVSTWPEEEIGFLSLIHLVQSPKFEKRILERLIYANPESVNMCFDGDGNSVVHCAARLGNLDALEVLLDNGGDVLALNAGGESVVDCCLLGVHLDCLTLVLKHLQRSEEVEAETLKCTLEMLRKWSKEKQEEEVLEVVEKIVIA